MCPHRHSVSVNPFPFAENEHKTAKSPEHSWRFVCTLAPSPISPSVPPSPFPLLSLPSPRFSRYDAGGRRDQEVRRDQVASSWSHPDGGTRSHPLGPILPLNKHTVRQRTLTHPVAVHTTYAEYAVARCASRTCTISFTHVLEHTQAPPPSAWQPPR